MEKKTMGSFMAALRKANGLTQQQVADKLNVSNKTISKWECNEGCPEISMLPVIAELYSVSADELLRGERIIKPFSEENREVKSVERIKYLVEKATAKFTNSSIVAIILGIVALILAYTICDIVYDYNVLWVGYAIVLILCSVSIAVSLIAFNNFISGLRSEDIAEKESFEESIKKCIKHITVITFLAAVTLFGLILNVLMNAPSYLFAALPATSVVGGIIAFFVRSFLYKKFSITVAELSLEQKQYRKKHIKITCVILSVVILFSFLLPLIFSWCETSVHSSYSFLDGVGYQYDSEEEAKREYQKLKDYVTGEKALYLITNEDYIEETDEYVLYVVQLQDSFELSESGYNMVSTMLSEEEELRFKNLEDAENFKAEKVCDDLNDYNFRQRNLIFYDETLSVSYQSETDDYFSGVSDIMPVFIIIGSCVFVIVFIISLVIYFKNINRQSGDGSVVDIKNNNPK